MNLLDSTGSSLSASYEYDAFGRLLTSSGTEAGNNKFRFSTKYYDSEADLYYYGYRWYTAKYGRWLSRDRIEENGGVDLYGFCHNRPTVAIDKLGLARMALR